MSREAGRAQGKRLGTMNSFCYNRRLDIGGGHFESDSMGRERTQIQGKKWMNKVGSASVWIICALSLITDETIAHENLQFREDRQSVYDGPGYRSARGGAPPIAFPANGIELLAWLPIVEFDQSMTSADDCWGYVSASGREYALIGLSDGTGFVEVTDPGDPRIVAVLPGPNSIWRDIKVYQDHVYAVSEGGSGIQVFDLGLIDLGLVTQVNTVTDGGATQTHNVAINEQSGFLYRIGGGGGTTNGLRIYDLADPANPTFVGQWNTRYVHDAQIVNYTSGPFAGQEIAFCFSETSSGGGTPGVNILNVTDKSNITQIAFFQYSTPVFSHQGWLSPDRQFLYVNDELDERNLGTPTTTRIIDVSDLTNPFQVSTFTNGSSAIDHNLYTLGNLIYEANYRSGLRIYDATNPLAPVEIAFFDTYPEDDSANFNGLWNNYPYLPSGIMIGSDIEKGLFVWWVGERLLAFDYPSGKPDLLDPDGDSLEVEIAEQGGGVLDVATAKLHYNAGEGFVEVDLTPIAGNLFDATFPELPCGRAASYFFTAKTDNNITWRDPPTAPSDVYTAFVALDQTVSLLDEMEADTGWFPGAIGDTATTGIWVRVDPNGTAAQPEDDHTASGTRCWVTGQGAPGGGLGSNDVDGGRTTLTSPMLDLTGISNPQISYWRWYSNTAGASPNADVFRVDISADDGVNWAGVEIVGPSGSGTSGGWFFHGFSPEDFIPLTSTVRMRFIAEDSGSGSIVEAAIDDFMVSTLDCGLVTIPPPTATTAGSRYLRVTPAPGVDPIALRITSPDLICLTMYADADGFLGDVPVFRTPDEWGIVLVLGEEIIPQTTYFVQAENVATVRSDVAETTTDIWGDVDVNLGVNFNDVQLGIKAFQEDFTLVTTERADIIPCLPNRVANIDDVLRTILIFQGGQFADLCTVPCE